MLYVKFLILRFKWLTKNAWILRGVLSKNHLFPEDVINLSRYPPLLFHQGDEESSLGYLFARCQVAVKFSFTQIGKGVSKYNLPQVFTNSAVCIGSVDSLNSAI